MATQWLRGTVKEVPSGDTVVVIGAVKAGPPPEKRLTLSSLIAPKLGKRDGSTRDEPFAWESREFLRTKLIGQPVVFKVDYVVEALGNREFGSVFLGQENMALSVATAGMAKVRAGGAQQSPYIEQLKKAEEAAQLAGLGVWTKEPALLSGAVREVPAGGDGAFDAGSFLAATGKGKVVPALVEQVVNGGMMRVTLLPSYQAATVVVCGVQAPSMGRRPTAAAGGEEGGEGAAAPAPAAAPAAPSAAAIAGTTQAEPFAREAKFLAEMRALNREVKLVVEGVDKYNNLFATVMVPPPPAAAPAPAAPAADAAAPAAPAAADSLAELLVRAGYAKCVEWSLNLMSNGGQRLRDLERGAKQEKRALWTNYVPAPTNQSKLSDTFTGKVVEVVSGDCLVIKDNANGVERRVQLSSLRAPRMGTRSTEPEKWATDAKEFLRKRVIGHTVEVKMEYTRKVPVVQEGGGNEERVLAFGNVELQPEGKGEEVQNVGEMVVARGFAQVVKHRSDEERSSVYEKLTACEALAKEAKRGVFSAKDPAANRINDVSQGGATKAKQYLPFFQRAGKMTGSVEFVLSGHRLKITVPKEGVTIVFAPSGIKTPSRAQPASGGKPAIQAEPFAEEAIAFTREHCMQRDCEITVETMDRGGTFLGTLTILGAGPQAKPLPLAVALVRAGLARLQPNVDPFRLQGGQELVEAQTAAKQARLKIWQNWTPEMDKEGAEEEEAPAAEAAGAAPGARGPRETLQVVVTEVVDASEFFVQQTNEPRVAWISEQLRGVALADAPVVPPELKVGQLCVAQYSLDRQFYRAYVERVLPSEPRYEVFFIDYGNKEKVSSKAVRTMDSALAAVPPQAQLCTLAHIKVPTGSAEYAGEARNLLTSLLGSGAPLTAQVWAREKPGPKDKHPRAARGKLTVSLAETATQADVAVELLCAGFARLVKLRRVRDPAAREAITALQDFEEEAREAHRGIFTYGDPGDSEDEEQGAPKPAGAWGKPR